MEQNIDIHQLQVAIENQTEGNKQLTLAEFEKAQELKRQTDEIEKDRISRDRRTEAIEKLIEEIRMLISIIQNLINKRHFENVEQLLEIIIPILSQVSTTLMLKDIELNRLASLISSTKADININSGAATNISEIRNKGTANFNDNYSKSKE